MPIVDGKYEAKLSTTFSTADEGVEEIKKMVGKSRAIRISSIPMTLLDELKPLLANKDLKIILPLGEKPTGDLKQLGDVATTKARIYVDYKGKEANTGSISFSTVIFNLVWLDNEILNISTMEYGTCVKCLRKTFDGAWRYSQKW
jgi:hypothetical protein